MLLRLSRIRYLSHDEIIKIIIMVMKMVDEENKDKEDEIKVDASKDNRPGVSDGSADKAAEDVSDESAETEESIEDNNKDNNEDNNAQDVKIEVEIDEKDVDVVSKEEIDETEKSTKPKENTDFGSWKPRTELGRQVKAGEIKDIDMILDNGLRILEPEIVDGLIPDLESDLLLIGQSKGKFGGGQKRVFRQTQKKTREGNKPKFSAFAVVGDMNGHVGLGYGKAKETVPAREKAFRKAKLNIMKIRRGCGSWQCSCGTPHTIPFKVSGKCGASELIFMPAPKGTGLCADVEIAKIMKLAGIKDIWSKTRGKSRTKFNHVIAAIAAITQLTSTKIQEKHKELLSIVEGRTAVRDASIDDPEISEVSDETQHKKVEA